MHFINTIYLKVNKLALFKCLNLNKKKKSIENIHYINHF